MNLLFKLIENNLLFISTELNLFAIILNSQTRKTESGWPNWGTPGTCRISQHHGIKGVKGDPQLSFHYAERRQCLSREQLVTFFFQSYSVPVLNVYCQFIWIYLLIYYVYILIYLFINIYYCWFWETTVVKCFVLWLANTSTPFTHSAMLTRFSERIL